MFDEIDDVFQVLESLFNQALKDHISLRQRRVKKLRQPTWINDNITDEINKRDQELRRARKSNAQRNWENNRRTKCFVTSIFSGDN